MVRASTTTSRAAVAEGRDRLAELTRDEGVDLAALGDELFAVLGLLDGQPALRRTLSDPARRGEDRESLLRRLIGDRVSAPTLDVAVVLVRQRWSSSVDLADAVEDIAVEAVVAQAERDGRLDDVEDELFRFVRIVDGDPRLRAALSDRAAPPAARGGLVDRLLADRTAPATQRLVRQAVLASRGRTIEAVLRHYGAVAADRRERLVAHVRAAVPLREEDRRRLAGALQRIYGHEVHLDIDVDPRVIGGVEVSVAGEVVDGTVVSRLAAARRGLTG